MCLGVRTTSDFYFFLFLAYILIVIRVFKRLAKHKVSMFLLLERANDVNAFDHIIKERTSFKSQAFCSHYEKTATDGKPCPKSQKPVCGTDGQTYHNLCEFCKTAM